MQIPPLTALNLSLSSGCGADCVFCPTDRGQRIRTKNMPFEIAQKAIDDGSVPTDVVRINHMSFGENGDAFLNKRALDVFRYAKEKIPHAFRLCTTNLQNLSIDMIEEIIRDNLLNGIDFNIDGFTGERFYAAKELSIEHVIAKFPKILEFREKYQSNLKIVVSILPMRKYIDATLKKLGKLPIKLKDPSLANLEDDTAAISAMIRPLLRPTDTIYEAQPFLWAEREQVDTSTLDYSQYHCPAIEWVTTKAYIAPNGDWYACCFDSNNELVVGNVMQQSLHEIAVGESRRLLIDRLVNQQFAEIGGPCATVNCCVQ